MFSHAVLWGYSFAGVCKPTLDKRDSYGCHMCACVPRPAAPVEWVFEMEDREEVQTL